MVVFLFVLAILAITVAINGNYNAVAKELQSDFKQGGNLLALFGVLIVIGLIGGTTGFTKTSRYIIVLIILAYIFGNSKGFVGNLTSVTKADPGANKTNPVAVGAPQAVGGK